MPEHSIDIDDVFAASASHESAWRVAAACRGMPIEAFFTEVATIDAQRACARCAVRLACLADEVGRPLEEICGFRGGLPETDRRSLLVDVARRRPDHWSTGSAGGRRAFDAGATVAAVASRFGVSVRTAYRWRSDALRRAG